MKGYLSWGLNGLLLGAVAALSIGWFGEHERVVAAKGALEALEAQIAVGHLRVDSAKDAPPDPEKQRRHIPLAGVPKGAANAPITIVEFSDFQCPFCARAAPTIDEVFTEYLGEIRFCFRHKPLPFHVDAALAAEASLAAEAQGKFWQMHDKLLANWRDLKREDLNKYAQELGLDMGAFEQALDARTFRSRVEQDAEFADSVGARGTPTFFVNGRMLTGAQPLEAFKVVIDEELAKAKQLLASGTPQDKLYETLTAAKNPGEGKPGRTVRR